MLKNEIHKLADNANAEIISVRFNNDIRYIREKKGRIIVSSYFTLFSTISVYLYIHIGSCIGHG